MSSPHLHHSDKKLVAYPSMAFLSSVVYAAFYSKISHDKGPFSASQSKLRMECTKKYYPSGAFSCRDQVWPLLMRNWISCDSGASIKALNGMYDKYYPSRAFSCHRHICTTLTRNWSPTHRRHFCRALYMQPSTQKFRISCRDQAWPLLMRNLISCDGGASHNF